MSSLAARRYAEAYFALAREHGEIDGWRAELARAMETVCAPAVQRALANPRLPMADRVRLVDDLLDGSSKPVRNLVRLLIERARARLCPELVGEYDRLADTERGIIPVEVTTAVAVNEQALDALMRAIAQQVGGTPRATVLRDPGIIGGVIIRIGDRVIDGSLRTQLQQLQATLT